MKKFKGTSGFSLIELMIVIAVIGILARIGVPSYLEYMDRGRQAEALSTLADMRIRMEQHFQDNRTYAAPAAACGVPAAGVIAPLPPATANFTYTCVATCAGAAAPLTATTYTVHACGNAGTRMAGFDLSIDQAGVRDTITVPVQFGWTMPAIPPRPCWTRHQSGAC